MSARDATVHVTICVLIGGVIAAFTPVRWIAGAFWVSAAMYINGSLAVAEDALPGGFENPGGSEASPVVKRWPATWFAARSLAIFVVLAAFGCYVQFA